MSSKQSKNSSVKYTLTQPYIRVWGYGNNVKMPYTQIPEVIKDWDEPMKSEMMEIYNERFPLTECEVCGKMFNKMRPTFTCSPECSHDRHNRIQLERGKKLVECNCSICGKTFTKRKYQQKYVCSPECSKEYQKVNKGQVERKGKKKKKEDRIAAIEGEMRAKGLRYADYQKQQTLAMVGGFGYEEFR